jgi:adenylate cyclase class 2
VKTREEREIKIPVRDLSKYRDTLVASGATPVSEPHLERNALFDDADGRLFAAGKALRVRHARGRGILTFKGKASFDGAVKHREELEVEISDPGLLETILGRLGFAPQFRYEKRREEYRWKDCVFALDETPIGSFIEIEGESGPIGEALSTLGLSAEDAVRSSYAGLYRSAREKDPRLPPDMVFPDSPR